MERYSMLYSVHTIGTVELAVETGRSAGLDNFLAGHGIADRKVLDDRIKGLGGFRVLPGYEAQPMDRKPMLVRYIPARMEAAPFHVMVCSGLEHRSDEYADTYRNVHVMAQDLLSGAGEYGWLDQIFGTRLVGWQENLDAKICPVDYDAPPVKVELPGAGADAVAVRIAAAAVWDGRSVVLELEDGCVFQERSMELLQQIYALLPPALAARTGFSSYEDPRRIPRLAAETDIRLFAVPGASGLKNGKDLLVLNLSQPPAASGETMEMVAFWQEMDWEKRRPVMERVFAGLEDPGAAGALLARTRDYRDNPFSAADEADTPAVSEPAAGISFSGMYARVREAVSRVPERLKGMAVPSRKSVVIIAAVTLALVLGLAGGIAISGGRHGETTPPSETVDPTISGVSPAGEVFVDGAINWSYVYTNVLDIDKVESEPAAMEQLLNRMQVTAVGDDRDLVAVIEIIGSDVEDPTFLTVRRIDGGAEAGDTVTEKPAPGLKALGSMEPAACLSNGVYRIEAYYHFGENYHAVSNNAVSAAQKIFRMITEDDAAVEITMMADGNIPMDLHAMMTAVTHDEKWWRESFKLDMRQKHLLAMQTAIDSNIVPVMLLYYNGAETVIYDYGDRADRKDEMVSVLESKGFSAGYVDDLVIALKAPAA